MRPTLEEAEKIIETGNYDLIPVSLELFADTRTPIQVLKALKKVSRHCFILDSVEASQNSGRYTFLGFDPVFGISCTDGKISTELLPMSDEKEGNPEEAIRKIMEENKSPRLEFLPSFTGGLVGYFSYDYMKYAEPSLKLDARDEEQFKDMDLMFFDKVIVFDHYRQKIILIVNARAKNPEAAGSSKAVLETEYNRAVLELEKMKSLVLNGEPEKIAGPKLHSALKPLFSREQYMAMVERAKHYIHEGDIFQVVLSNRLEAEFEGSLLDVYRVLRTTNPSPYMFYFSSDDIEIAGASPETMAKLNHGKVQTFPLAGTRKRGVDAQEDQQLEEGLLKDEKECSEHNMLVDLGRNDIGKVSAYGTVHVEEYMRIHKYSHVMHIGSTVSGTLMEGKNALDVISAVLPAGTLSGAPKIRACEIINELEDNKRGIYGGAIGYLGFNGDMDTCIAIRLVFSKNGKLFVRSGAGIVADSVPENEYQECINKAKAVDEAIRLAQEGIEK